MTENSVKLKFSHLTIRDALKIASDPKTDKTRAGLVKLIGEDLFDSLCRLGYITQGATIDLKKGERVAVWKRTDRPNPYDILDDEIPQKRLPGIENLAHIM